MLEIKCKIGDKIRITSNTLELIVPVTDPATFVDLEDGMEGEITEILEDGVTITFNDWCSCDFQNDEFEGGFLEVISPPLATLSLV